MERIKNYLISKVFKKDISPDNPYSALALELNRFSSGLVGRCFQTQPKDCYLRMDAITAVLHESGDISGTKVSRLALKYGYGEDDLSISPRAESFEVILDCKNDQNEILKRIVGFSRIDGKLIFQHVRANNNDESWIEEIIQDPEENTFVVNQALLALKKFTPTDCKFDR